MYKSPIEVIMHDLPAKIVKDEENMVLLEVRKQISVDVDKYELKKALAYDRNQYEKGFEDARKQFERPHGEWIPVDIEEWVFRCSLCRNVSDFESRFCPNCGSSMISSNSERR